MACVVRRRCHMAGQKMHSRQKITFCPSCSACMCAQQPRARTIMCTMADSTAQRAGLANSLLTHCLGFTLELHGCSTQAVAQRGFSLKTAGAALLFVSSLFSGAYNLSNISTLGVLFSLISNMAENRGPQLLGVNIALSIITCSVVLLRCYTRAFIVKAFGADDWIMILATVSASFEDEQRFLTGLDLLHGVHYIVKHWHQIRHRPA